MVVASDATRVKVADYTVCRGNQTENIQNLV